MCKIEKSIFCTLSLVEECFLSSGICYDYHNALLIISFSDIIMITRASFPNLGNVLVQCVMSYACTGITPIIIYYVGAALS